MEREHSPEELPEQERAQERQQAAEAWRQWDGSPPLAKIEGDQPIDVEHHVADPQRDERVRWRREATLGDMARDGYIFFTPALLRTHGRFDRDPVVEFLRSPAGQRLSADEQPFFVDCERPLFEGLASRAPQAGLVDWNRRVYGIRQEAWPACHAFLGSIAFWKATWHYYARVGSYELTVVDPTAFSLGRVLRELPQICVHVLCVASNYGFFVIEPARDPPRTLPYVRRLPPREDTLREAEAMLGPPPSPKRLAQLMEGKHGDDDHRPPPGRRSQKH